MISIILFSLIISIIIVIFIEALFELFDENFKNIKELSDSMHKSQSDFDIKNQNLIYQLISEQIDTKTVNNEILFTLIHNVLFIKKENEQMQKEMNSLIEQFNKNFFDLAKEHHKLIEKNEIEYKIINTQIDILSHSIDKDIDQKKILILNLNKMKNILSNYSPTNFHSHLNEFIFE